MASAGSQKSRKRRPVRPRDERVRHVIEIADWEYDYMFGVGGGPFSDDPYMDFRHFNIKGKLLRPSALQPDIAEVTLFPDYRLSESEDRHKHKPKTIGAISHRGKAYRASLHLPADAFALVLQMMIADRYRFMLIEAEKSFRGEALVRHFRLTGTIDEDELD